MSATYIGHILGEVNKVTTRCGPVLLYGENIDTGSRIAGLARGITVNPAGRIQNIGNCELTHCGIGFGMMMDGANAVLFVKQLDFMLLGLDQITNTFNFIRAFRTPDSLGGFTIFVIVCDQGYQGPQSSFNGAGDFASLANVDVYCLNATQDVTDVVSQRFVSPGFRLVCVSQRLFSEPALPLSAEYRAPDGSVFKYRTGSDLTLVCYNFSLREGLGLADQLGDAGLTADVFHANYLPAMDTSVLEESCGKTGRLTVLDDSKSVAKFGDALVTRVVEARPDVAVLSLGRRGTPTAQYGCCEDRFIPDAGLVLSFARGRLKR